MRFTNTDEAIRFLLSQPSAKHDRKHDAIVLKNPSLRCMGAVDYLRKALGKTARTYLYTRDGQTTVYRISQFAGVAETAQ